MNLLFKKFLAAGLEASSLVIFLVYLQLWPPQVRADWLPLYGWASAAGLFALAVPLAQRTRVNPIFLGIQCYFVSGFLALWLAFDWLNDLYGLLRGAAMLGWVLLLGLAYSLCSRGGFVGADPVGFWTRGQQSLLLLTICSGCLALALGFAQSRLLGEFVPFMLLFSAQNLLLGINRRFAATRTISSSGAT